MGELQLPAEDFSLADDFAARRPLPAGRVYHFHVIYNHARCPLSATQDSVEALQWTRRAVERMQLQGLVNTYYHDRDCPKGLSFRQELDRVLEGSEVTVLLLTPGFLRECWPRYWLLSSFRRLFTPGSDGTSATPAPSPPWPPPYTSSFLLPAVEDLTNYCLESRCSQEAEVLNRPVSSVVLDAEFASSEKSAVQLSSSLFASAHYPSNCLEDVAYSSTPPFLSSDYYRSSNKDSARLDSFSLPTNQASSKTAVDQILNSSQQFCASRKSGSKDGDRGGGRVVVVVALGVAKSEVPAVVKEGREVLFFGDGGERDSLAWSRLEGWLLAAMPPPAVTAGGRFASPVRRRKTPERRPPPTKTPQYSQLLADLAAAEQDLKYGRRGKEHSRTKTYPIPSRHYPLHNGTDSLQAPVTDQSLSRHRDRSAQRTRLSDDHITTPSSLISYGQSSSGHRGRLTQRERRSQVDITNPASVSPHVSASGYGRSTQRTRPAYRDMTYPRSVSHPIHWPSRHHFSSPLPLSSTLTASSSFLPKRSHHWVPAEREESPVRKGRSSSNSSRGQPVQEGDRQQDHESGAMRPELSSPGVSVSSVEKSRHQPRTSQAARSHVQNGQQQNFGTANGWYDIQEIPSKLPRDEASVSAAKDHRQIPQLTSTSKGLKEENRDNSSASNIGRLRKSEKPSDRSPQNDFRSTALDHLAESGIKQEVLKGSPRSTGKSRSSAFSVVQSSVSRKEKNGRSHEGNTVLPRKQNTLIISSDKAELVYQASQISRKSVDRQPKYEENDNMVKTGSPNTQDQTDCFEQVAVTKVMTAATETSAQTSDKHFQGHDEPSLPFSPKTSVPLATNLHLEPGSEHSREHRTALSTGWNHDHGQVYSIGTPDSISDEKKTDIRSCHGNDHDSEQFWHCTSTSPTSEKSSSSRDEPDVSVLLDFQTDVDVSSDSTATAGDSAVGSIPAHSCTDGYASGDKEHGHDKSVMIKSTEPRYGAAMISEWDVTGYKSKHVTCESPTLTCSQEHSLTSQKGELQCVTGDSSNNGRFRQEITDSHIPESPSINQNIDSIVADDHHMAERSGSFMPDAETDSTSLLKPTTIANFYETDRNNGLAGVMLPSESGSRKPSERSLENGKETQVHGKGIKTEVPKNHAGTQRDEQHDNNYQTDTQPCLIQSEKQLFENKPEAEHLRIQTEAETSSHELECQLAEHRTEPISSDKSSKGQALKRETDEIFQDRSKSEPQWYQHEFEINAKEGQKETQQQKVPPEKTEIKTPCGEARIQAQRPGSEDEISPQGNPGLTSLFNNTFNTQPFENPFAKQPYGTLAETLSVETLHASSPYQISDKALPFENSAQTPPSGNPVETLPYQTSSRSLQHESSPETQTHEDLTEALACDGLSYASLDGGLDETLSSENGLTRELFVHNPEEIPTLEDMMKATPHTMLEEPILARENATEETSLEKMVVVAAPHEKSEEADHLEKMVKATSHAVLAETPPQKEVAETSSEEEIAKTLPQEQMAETTPQEETTLQEEVAETTLQEEVAETTLQEEVAETTLQEEGVETTLQEEVVETLPEEEVAETLPEEEVAETLPEEEIAETLPEEEVEETRPQEEVAETSPQEEVAETTLQEERADTAPQEKTEEATLQVEVAETRPKEKTEETSHRNLAKAPPNDTPTEAETYSIRAETPPHENTGEILSDISLPSTRPTPNTTEIQADPLPCEHQGEPQLGDSSQTSMLSQKSAKQTALYDETLTCQNPVETMSHENHVETLFYGTPVQTLPSQSLSESRLHQDECETLKEQTEVETILPTETESVKIQCETQVFAKQAEERFVEHQAGESPIISSTSEVCTSTPEITYQTTGFENSAVKTDAGTVPPLPPPPTTTTTTAAQTDTKPRSSQHTVFSEDDPSFSDFLSSSFVTSDDGALSLSADWSGAGNDSGFLSGGLLSFGETSPRVSTPRTRSQDTQHHTDGEGVIRHPVSDSDTSKASSEAEETTIAEEQHHHLLSAHAGLDMQRVTDRTFHTEHFSSEGVAVMEGAPHTNVIYSDRVSSHQPHSSTDPLRLEPPGPRLPASGRRMVHFRAEGVSVSSPSDVEPVSSAMRMESSDSCEGIGHSEVATGRVAGGGGGGGGGVSQAEGAAAVTRPDDPSGSEEAKPAEERTISRRVLPALVRMVCHAISRPENPYF